MQKENYFESINTNACTTCKHMTVLNLVFFFFFVFECTFKKMFKDVFSPSTYQLMLTKANFISLYTNLFTVYMFFMFYSVFYYIHIPLFKRNSGNYLLFFIFIFVFLFLGYSKRVFQEKPRVISSYKIQLHVTSMKT